MTETIVPVKRKRDDSDDEYEPNTSTTISTSSYSSDEDDEDVKKKQVYISTNKRKKILVVEKQKLSIEELEYHYQSIISSLKEKLQEYGYESIQCNVCRYIEGILDHGREWNRCDYCYGLICEPCIRKNTPINILSSSYGKIICEECDDGETECTTSDEENEGE